jgi:hypothetical protein
MPAGEIDLFDRRRHENFAKIMSDFQGPRDHFALLIVRARIDNQVDRS